MSSSSQDLYELWADTVQETAEQKQDLGHKLSDSQTIVIIETSRGLESARKLPEPAAKGFVDGFNLATEMWDLDGGASIWSSGDNGYLKEDIDKLVAIDQGI